MRIHARLIALIALSLAGLTLTGCEDITQKAVGLGGPQELSQGTKSQGSGDCPVCAKFKARPPSGLNAPPML